MFSVLEEENHVVKEGDTKIFSGNSNIKLANEICKYLEILPGRALVSKFANGEIQVKIEESVRGTDVFVIQSMCHPVNNNLMELLIMIDALSRASANTITAVIPHYGYAKQEKKTAGREPITAKLVANLITTAGADRIITVDLHAAAIQGFFDIPVDNLYAMPILVDYFIKKGMKGQNTVIVSPDAGGVARARTFAVKLEASLAIIFKRRPKPDETEITEIVGEVDGKDAIMVDDMISTGKTLIKGAEALLKRGAKSIYACATHPILAKDAAKYLRESPIKELIVTNTIPIDECQLDSKVRILSVSSLLGEAIRRNYFNLSVSKLFE